MKADRAFSDLIGRIYDCALDPDRWIDVLAEITGELGGHAAEIIVSHPLERRQRGVYLYNWPPDLFELMVANSHLNPMLPMGLTYPLCEPFCVSRHMDVAAYRRCRFYQSCLEGRGVGDYIAVPVTRTVTSFSSWGVVAREDKPAFADEEIELSRLLAPHIKRAIEISGVLGDTLGEAKTLRAALDALAAAAMIIEPDGKVRYCNRAGQTEFARGTVLREHHGKVVPVAAEAGRFLAMLRSSNQRHASRGLDATLEDGTGRSLHVTWAVLDKVEAEMGSPILLLLREQEQALTTPLTVACQRYALTTAETQVLAQLLEGRTLADVASIIGVARSTVKTHLESIYRKTRTRRQAELVRLVMELSPLLSP